MREILEGVYLFEGLSTVNVFALESDGGVTLIDTGTRGSVDPIVKQLKEQEFDLSKLKYIVVTHAHVDHMGGLAELARRTDARVVAHRAEVPFIEQGQSLPAASPFISAVTWVGDRVLTREACRVDMPVDDGDVIEVLGGLQVLHTPGHTPGSICLYQPELRVLFCGDLLFNKNPVTGRKGLRHTLAGVSQDVSQARESVNRLLDLAIETLCPGHGEPILKNAGLQIQALVSGSAV